MNVQKAEKGSLMKSLPMVLPSLLCLVCSSSVWSQVKPTPPPPSRPAGKLVGGYPVDRMDKKQREAMRAEMRKRGKARLAAMIEKNKQEAAPRPEKATDPRVNRAVFQRLQTTARKRRGKEGGGRPLEKEVAAAVGRPGEAYKAFRSNGPMNVPGYPGEPRFLIWVAKDQSAMICGNFYDNGHGFLGYANGKRGRSPGYAPEANPRCKCKGYVPQIIVTAHSNLSAHSHHMYLFVPPCSL